MGCKSRRWLILGTFLQSLFTMSAALAIWKSGKSSVANSRGEALWTNVLAFVCVSFMSMSLGLQGIMAKRVNTQFTTTSAFPPPPPFSPMLTETPYSRFNNNMVRTDD